MLVSSFHCDGMHSNIEIPDLPADVEMQLLEENKDRLRLEWQKLRDQGYRARLQLEIQRAEGVPDRAAMGCYCSFTIEGDNFKTRVRCC